MNAIELSDAEIEARREPMGRTLDFVAGIESTCVRNVAALSTIGGNVLLHVRDVGAWTLVTRGPIVGLFPDATDDEVDFAMSCEEWVLHELLDPGAAVDLKAYAKAGLFRAEGDFRVFQRLLKLGQGGAGNAVGVRARRD